MALCCIWLFALLLWYATAIAHVMDLANVYFHLCMKLLFICYCHCEACLRLGKVLYKLNIIILLPAGWAARKHGPAVRSLGPEPEWTAPPSGSAWGQGPGRSVTRPRGRSEAEPGSGSSPAADARTDHTAPPSAGPSAPPSAGPGPQAPSQRPSGGHRWRGPGAGPRSGRSHRWACGPGRRVTTTKQTKCGTITKFVWDVTNTKT